jgi:hypothetical protein
MSYAPEVVAIAAGLIGAIIGAAPGIISSWLSYRAKEKQQRIDMISDAATKTWEFHVANAKIRGGPILPLEHYVMHSTLMNELIFDGKKRTKEELMAELSRIKEVAETLFEHASTFSYSHEHVQPDVDKTGNITG